MFTSHLAENFLLEIGYDSKFVWYVQIFCEKDFEFFCEWHVSRKLLRADFVKNFLRKVQFSKIFCELGSQARELFAPLLIKSPSGVELRLHYENQFTRCPGYGLILVRVSYLLLFVICYYLLLFVTCYGAKVKSTNLSWV